MNSGAVIVAQVDPELMKLEGRRAAKAQPDDMTAQDLLLQATAGDLPTGARQLS